MKFRENCGLQSRNVKVESGEFEIEPYDGPVQEEAADLRA